jgi:FKBP-type peptidyl-prolyl cis-trans isomerase
MIILMRLPWIQRFKDSKIQNFWNFGILIFFVLSCGRSYNTQQPAQDLSGFERQKNEILLRVNQQLVEEDAEVIETYAAQKGWQLKTTESGLSYMIYASGQGEKATAGKIATLVYTVSLLDSTVCYSSEQLGIKEFQLGHGGVEAGLEEGVLLMRVGDKARLFMPPHLAHGLTGDGDCIPRRAIILYDVELVRLD